jgi:hypothetical protein
VLRRFEYDIAASTAVAAVWTTEFHKGLAAH